MKRPNGIVAKFSRGLVRVLGHRSRKGKAAEVTPEEVRSIKLGIVPEGDFRKRNRTDKRSVKQRLKAIRDWERDNPKPELPAAPEKVKPRVLPACPNLQPSAAADRRSASSRALLIYRHLDGLFVQPTEFLCSNRFR